MTPPPTRGWWGDGDPPWEVWPGVSLRLDATWTGDRWESPCGRYYFDPAAADRPGEFMHEYLRQTKGAFDDKPLDLLPWQSDLLVRPLFGWKRTADGRRRFRRVFCEVAKKNGKSTIASGLGLYLFSADGEPGAEVYVAAGDEEQARIVWGDASTMASESPDFLDDAGVEVLANSILQPKTNSKFMALTSKAATKHGPNVHALIFDELHAQKSRTLYETLKRGISARTQPVILVITTAGDDRESICYEEHTYACRVRDGLIEDPEVLPIVFQLADPADWANPDVWKQANPSLGVTKQLDYMETECRAAQSEPRKRNDFLRLELNVWTESRTVWISPETWAECRREEKEPADWPSLMCCLGMDLSETTDLTALVAAFKRPDERPAEEIPVEGRADEEQKVLAVDFSVDLKAWFFIPREKMLERSKRDGVPYDLWAREGWVRVTDGAIIDYSAIVSVILREVAPKYRIGEIGFDPWNAAQISGKLKDDHGLPMVAVRQGYLSMSAPSKLLEGLVAARRITHDGNPCLSWCFANAEVTTDPAGNIKPVKPGGDSRGTRRIDGVTATVTALSRLMVVPDPRESVYATRGVQVLRW